jgi:serine/threonine protein kinase
MDENSVLNVSTNQANFNSSKRTLFSEYEAIEIVIQIIDLLEFLHSQDIIHTNLNPANIFLKNENTNTMIFLNLYHCSWQPEKILQNMKLGPEY